MYLYVPRTINKEKLRSRALYEIKSDTWGAVGKQRRQTNGFLSRYMMVHILDL